MAIFFEVAELLKEVSADPDNATVKKSGSDAVLLLDNHRRIVRISNITGIIGFISGLIVFLESNYSSFQSLYEMIVGTLLIGTLFGMIAAFPSILIGITFSLAMAPTFFLKSPIGKRWMSFIGVKKIVEFRVASILIGLFFSYGLISTVFFDLPSLIPPEKKAVVKPGAINSAIQSSESSPKEEEEDPIPIDDSM